MTSHRHAGIQSVIFCLYWLQEMMQVKSVLIFTSSIKNFYELKFST